jgi:peptide chain release factor 2
MQELKSDFELFKKSFDLAGKEEQIKKLTEDSLDPELWNDQNKAKQVMQDLADLKAELDEVKNLEEEIGIVGELSNDEDEDMANEIKKIEGETSCPKSGLLLVSLL